MIDFFFIRDTPVNLIPGESPCSIGGNSQAAEQQTARICSLSPDSYFAVLCLQRGISIDGNPLPASGRIFQATRGHDTKKKMLPNCGSTDEFHTTTTWQRRQPSFSSLYSSLRP